MRLGIGVGEDVRESGQGRGRQREPIVSVVPTTLSRTMGGSERGVSERGRKGIHRETGRRVGGRERETDFLVALFFIFSPFLFRWFHELLILQHIVSRHHLFLYSQTQTRLARAHTHRSTSSAQGSICSHTHIHIYILVACMHKFVRRHGRRA